MQFGDARPILVASLVLDDALLGLVRGELLEKGGGALRQGLAAEDVLPEDEPGARCCCHLVRCDVAQHVQHAC